jgi:hypothetical protein
MLRGLFATPLWVRLRFVSNSTAAKATILVPLIGYLILFNEKVVEFLNLAKDIGSHGGAEASYRLISTSAYAPFLWGLSFTAGCARTRLSTMGALQHSSREMAPVSGDSLSTISAGDWKIPRNALGCRL